MITIRFCCMAMGALLPLHAADVRMIDFTDPTYGGRVRQISNPAGDEHDLYHYRSVFNADNSCLLEIETPKGSTDYRVTPHDGDGRSPRELVTQEEYDWPLAWDRGAPRSWAVEANIAERYGT